MRVMIVYDSVFGNSEQVARALGAALGEADRVEVLRVGEAAGAPPTDLGLLIVGSPTRGFRPTPAVAEFLQQLPAGSLARVKVAAFDTRTALEAVRSRFLRGLLRLLVRLGGYAAAPIAAGLERAGGTVVQPPEGFCVLGTEGPLKQGELERAAGWARAVRQAAAASDDRP